MKLILKLLAPYFAVGVFWCVFENAWLAILAYHLQILLWSRRSFFDMRRPVRIRIMFLAVPMVTAGPLLYYLLPYITHTDLSLWLEWHHLSRLGLMVMIPYFGLLHPFLEQIHWAGLREITPSAHTVFAGYHMLVLYSLLTIPGLFLCFIVLTAASFMWHQMRKRSDSILLPVTSHVLANMGIVIVAWLKT